MQLFGIIIEFGLVMVSTRILDPFFKFISNFTTYQFYCFVVMGMNSIIETYLYYRSKIEQYGTCYGLSNVTFGL